MDSRARRWCTAAGSPVGLPAAPRHDRGMKSRVHPTYKAHYRVGNWRAYERGLVSRGDVTLWLSPDAKAGWGVPPSGRPGGQQWFSDLAIETALTLRLVFHLPLRQTEGFVRSILTVMRASLDAPDHTTLSRRSQSLHVAVHNIPATGPLHLIVDSTECDALAVFRERPRHVQTRRVRESANTLEHAVGERSLKIDEAKRDINTCGRECQPAGLTGWRPGHRWALCTHVERPDAPIESISDGWSPKQRLVEARLFEDGVHDVASVGRPRDAADFGIPVRAAVSFTTGNGSDIDIADTRPLVSDECQRPSVWRDVERRAADSTGRVRDLGTLGRLAVDLEDPIGSAGFRLAIPDKQRPAVRHPGNHRTGIAHFLFGPSQCRHDEHTLADPDECDITPVRRPGG
ncbi:transposase [Luteitalea pratensis]|uniref:transposase n=1 Tax=Luteitalea pratensis TaxID=1855912 RepID=UPI003AAE0C03